MGDVVDQAEVAVAAFDREALANSRVAMAASQGNNPGGRCVACDDAIPPARLAIIPGALRCVPCQELHAAHSHG
jgi:phage/conjugal plasmid C-4 type zinc finger TraR family protein